MLKQTEKINDNQLSDAWNALPDETTGALKLLSRDNTAYGGQTGSGQIVDGIAARTTANAERVLLLTMDISAATGDYYLDDLVVIDPSVSAAPTSIDISSYQITYNTETENKYISMCLFSTEAKRYVCFVGNTVKKLFYYDFSTLKTCDLPFYPKKIVPHYNRVFAIDTGNKLWWCRAGDLTTWYGLDRDDDYVVTSTNMVNSTYTVLANPDVPRPLMVTVTKTSTIDTMGIITVVGTDVLDEAMTEIITPVDGIAYGQKAFKTVTSITGSGWSAVAGTDKIKIGIAPVTGFTQEDAGVWTLEQEYTLIDMVVIGTSLYIFSPYSIYIFQGYSYDSFVLSKAIANLGCYEDSKIVCWGNVAYFYGAVDKLYEYNGNDYPTIINRPVYVNGSVANGVYGSIPDYFTSAPMLFALQGKLYTYATDYSEGYCLTETTGIDLVQWCLYCFDIRSRTWWKLPGLESLYSDTYGEKYAGSLYVPNVAQDDSYSFLWLKDTAGDATWTMYYYTGGDAYSTPYVVTKGFSGDVSGDLTLTNIILLVRGSDPETSMTINVYYALVIEGNDISYYTLLKSFKSTDFDDSGVLDRLVVNVPSSSIGRKDYFKILITSSANLQITGIEYRYRQIDRSR